MVATISKAATADYYIHSQASFRPPGEYYLSGEEPDGFWWNPVGLFASEETKSENGETIDSADFYRLYRGLDPRTGDKLTRNADSEKRCPGYDITFNADKSISALWAIAPADLREELEKAHNDSVRIALEDTIQANCSYTRVQGNDRTIKIVPANMMAGLFQHGASRSNDPHLHTHCVILNLAKAHQDGKWRALHGNPLFSWQKAAGATYRAELAWLLRDRLGIEMETHGNEQQYTRIKGTPEDLIKDWSKRDVQINDTAARFGATLQGNGGLHNAIQRLTRAAKDHSLDPEGRHTQWTEHAESYIGDIPAYIESITGKDLHVTDEQKLEIAARLAAIPAELTQYQSVFKYTDLVEKTANAAAGLLSREQRQRMLEQVLKAEEMVELDKPDTSYDSGALLAHSRTFTAAHTIETERRIHELANELHRTDLFAIPAETTNAKVEQLKADNYPVSDEQIQAMRASTQAGQITIIEGAAGSGKTTTLRPIADLYREAGHDIIATSVSWRVTLALGNDLDAPNWCVDKLNLGIAKGSIPAGAKTVIVVDEAGQLSSLQAVQILEMARSSGAKIIFAGDTEQQQPVEAGPGLRLIRDVIGTTRVDTIRRQKADIEDILVAIHGQDLDTAKRWAEIATPEHRERILANFEAQPEDRKTAIKPWQVTASEHFRDGEAAKAVAAYNSRGRIHIENSLNATFVRLIDAWDKLRQEQPDATRAVIAYSRAEVKALSFLMRERILQNYEGPRYSIQSYRSREPRAKAEALEIAVGDTLRIGPVRITPNIWQKHLFNGTHIEVLELRQEGARRDAPDEPRLWIRARTDRGRIVEFHHDEIVDYHGKIRLDHGYAMTMNAAQGLTVDRAFVFANQKPARETIYPAMTRHRERVDVYIDREPVELDVRHQRHEETSGDPVTNDDILAYLAKNWSRSRQEEAAQDYMSEHMRARTILGEERIPPAPAAARETDRNRTAEPPTATDQDRAPTDIGTAIPAPAGASNPTAVAAETASRRADPEGLGAAQWLAANDAGDGQLSEIAKRIRYSEIEIRHRLAAQTIGQACRKLNASLADWDKAREQNGNAAIAMDPTFRNDLRESSAILRTVKPFLQGDPLHARVLREHGGIDVSDIDTLARSQRRAISIRDMSIADRRRLDPEFTPAIPQPTREDVAVETIEHALEALEPRTATEAVETRLEPPPDLWEGWDERHAEADIHIDDFSRDRDSGHDRDTGLPPNIAPEWIDPDDEFGHDDSYEFDEPTRAPEPEPSREPSHPDPAAGARDTARRPEPALTAPQRIEILELNYSLHITRARADGTHPFLTPGWHGIHRDMVEIASLPDIDDSDRGTLRRSIQISDTWYAHNAPDRRPQLTPVTAADHTQESAALIQDHRRRLQNHCEQAFERGIHPFDAAGWQSLENELHAFLDRPDIGAADRLDVARELAAISAEQEDRKTHDVTRPAPQAASPDQAAQHLYNEHRRRHDAYVESILDPAAPRALDQNEWNELKRGAHELLELPELPPDLRRDLIRTYEPERYFELAIQAIKLSGAAQPPAPPTPYDEFNARFGKHATAAEKNNLHPYQMPGWKDVADQARHLLGHTNLTERQETNLRKLLDHYRAWSRAHPEPAQTRDRDTSQGMGF